MIYCMKCYVDFDSAFLYILNTYYGFSFICERPAFTFGTEKVIKHMLKPFSQVCILWESFSYLMKSLQILYFVLWNIMFPATLTRVVEGYYIVWTFTELFLRDFYSKDLQELKWPHEENVDWFWWYVLVAFVVSVPELSHH